MGYAFMTQTLRQLCPKIVVVLEGGYDLHALSVSSEAVVQTLRIHPNDTESLNKYLTELYEENQQREGKVTNEENKTETASINLE